MYIEIIQYYMNSQCSFCEYKEGHIFQLNGKQQQRANINQTFMVDKLCCSTAL